MPTSRIVALPTEEFMTRASAAGVDLPLEQSAAWDTYDLASPGRQPYGRYVWQVDGEDRAFISLTDYRGRGFHYLWAKEGPVWTEPPTAQVEERFHSDLTRVLKKDWTYVFVRLHAHHTSVRLHELLQSIPFDRTVILDLSLDSDALMASMKKRGRRDVRKSLRNENLVAAEETDQASLVFDELYELLKETGDRDGFGIAPKASYMRMLTSLGSEHARLFTVRAHGEPYCWGIVTVNGPRATYYYAASSAEGRKAGAPDLLVWYMTEKLRESGVTSFDLMGVDSERAPQLAGVRGFKTKFSEEIAEVPGAWDLPLRPVMYQGLTLALKAKRAAMSQMKKLRSRSDT
ncbi:lipid II:glycine glycyltransferase FemX [Flaviflexus huanghaiensis]|uniref:lipid II:glycine glycyltransferase FemX n=1 Tax=Flaviflexus huanghaiensis TaxID=1111473 RepID=UPI0015F89188|nr:peptidoglycan bridge formation glycyltransferase FemA/FemB family protein [Flaviflexus huanghaiensis]